MNNIQLKEEMTKPALVDRVLELEVLLRILTKEAEAYLAITKPRSSNVVDIFRQWIERAKIKLDQWNP